MDARCRIEFLGGLRVRQGDRWITRFRTQKTGALLAYLAYYGHRSHPREVLVDLLWPERDRDAGRNSLSTSLSSLRHQLEPPGVPAGAVIAADRASVGFNPAAVTTDVADFEAALHTAERGRSRTERLQELAAAVEFYGGPLLPGYYEDWIGPEQERLAELHFQAIRRLIADLEAEADLDRALTYARRAVSADPLREEAHQELIRLYAAAGQPSDARRQYRELQRILKEELDTTPTTATRDLLRSMPSRAPRPGSPAASTTEPPVPGLRTRDAIALPSLRSGGHPETRDLPTGTVTFLLTDIAGSTALWERAGEAFQRALASHHTLLRRVFHQHDGLEVKETGDAFLVAFQRAADALEGAVAGQRALAGHPWPDEVEMLRVRMVLHTGDVELQDGDYHGLVLHRAARMLVAAHGGQILCSEATAAVLRRDLEPGVRLGDLGVYRLRDVAMPERLFQVEYPDMPQRQFPPLHAEAGYAGNLPLRLTRFFGREEELSCLGEMLLPPPGHPSRVPSPGTPGTRLRVPGGETRDARLVTLMGPGGSGKTRLALEVAARLVEPFHGAVWFVPLADLVDARLIADAVMDTLRLPRSPHVEPLEQVVEALTRQPSLLILDNFEQLVREGAAIVRTMLERVPTLKCLVTSRQALDLEGEREFVVAPLPTPDGAHIPEQLTLCESVQLFVDRAQAVRPDFQVTNANASAVAALCNRLEGIPLALELAAARSQVLTPAQILTHLEHRLDFLVSRRRDAAARQRSLRAAIDWSYGLLPSELQRFFARLSVFRGGWTLEAAEEVCAEPLSLDYLAQLRECSLVVVEEARRAGGPDRPCSAAAGGEMRFGMLETLREYAAEQRKPDDRAALERRHLEHYLALAEDAEPGLVGPEEGVWLERLAAEYENLRAALRWGSEREPVLALRLAGALGQFWEVRGLWAEGRDALDQVSERAADAPPEFQIKASQWAGTLAWRHGEYERARELLQRSLDLARAAGDSRGIVKALLGLGNVSSDQGDDALARALYAESLAAGRETGDAPGIAAALNGLGCIALDHQGDYPAARALFEESLAIRRQIGDRWSIAGSLNNLGLVALNQGDYPAAQAFHEESLRLRRQIGDRRGMALSLNNLGCIASNQGDHAAARALYEESLAIGREIGDPWAIAGSLNNLGELAQAQGDYHGAGAFFMDALLVNRQLRNRPWQAIGLDNLGDLARARGESEAAQAFYRESLELRRQIEERSGIAASLERFACLAAGQEQAEPHSPKGHAAGLRAVRLFGAAEALREASGASLPPGEQVERDARVATLRQHLGDTAFTAAWEAGSSLTWQEAAAEALE